MLSHPGSVPRIGHALVVTAALTFALQSTSPLTAQSRGDYMNIESVQVAPIALARVQSIQVLVVCNTPDDSIEIWSTDESIQPPALRFMDRLEVGLEPVSVLVVGDRFWTTNFLGDSVTTGQLVASGGVVQARFLNTRNLPAVPGTVRGDEPVHVAFVDDGDTRALLVSMFSGSAVAWLDPDTLLPLPGAATAYTIQNSGNPPLGIKEPRTILVRDNRVFVLATKGGSSDSQSQHDLDLLSAPLGAPLVFDRWLPDPSTGASLSLGTTNYNMTFASNGDLYVVGGDAQNFTTNDKIAVRNEPTGFVRSMVWRVVGVTAATPTVYGRDLNRTSTNAIVPNAAPFSVEGLPISQPTDVAVLEQGGVLQKLYIAAMGSDRIVTLTPPAGGIAANPDPATWIRATIALPLPAPGGNPMYGPRALVLGTSASGARLWVLNRLDNSVSIIDTTTDTLLTTQSFALAFDPTPSHVRSGRRFLYDARLSGTGFVSCASCHVDARTDALAWRLGNPNAVAPLEAPPSPAFIQSIAGTGTFATLPPGGLFPWGFTSDPDYLLAMMSQQTFDPTLADENVFASDDKREMVTQSLQGLLNYDTDQDTQTAVTNAPYHWRGDKPTFRDFNEAFETLMLAPNASGGFPAGLSDDDMLAYEDFVNSIVYPPNPKQPKTRVYSESDDSVNFAGGVDGLRLFHERPTILGNRSCVTCHTLPEGSNNRLTVFAPDFGITNFLTAVYNRQPIESAAMRGLFQKEPLLEPDGNFIQNPLTTPRLGHAGFNHNGVQVLTGPWTGTGTANMTSMNTFIDLFFAGITTSFDARAVKQFSHELDWGVAPMVGEVACLDLDMFTNPARAAELTQQSTIALAIQGQANVGNAGCVVWMHRPNQAAVAQRYRGFRWYPPLQFWVEEPTYGLLTTSTLLGLLTDPADRMVVLGVPLGNDRRIAGQGGSESSPLIPTVAPSALVMLALKPDTANVAIPGFVTNWSPNLGTAGSPVIPPGAPAGLLTSQLFTFIKPDSALNPAVDEVWAKLLRLYQYGLMKGTGANDYGVPWLRHEAPRRLQISGVDIYVGAKLFVDSLDPTAGYAGPPPSTAAGQAALPTRRLTLPLHPTDQTDARGYPIWETAVELDPLVAYQLMLGGLGAPGVSAAITDVFNAEYNAATVTIQEPTTGAPPFAVSASLPFDPANWNWHRISVQNPVPTGATPAAMTSAPVWVQLKM